MNNNTITPLGDNTSLISSGILGYMLILYPSGSVATSRKHLWSVGVEWCSECRYDWYKGVGRLSHLMVQGVVPKAKLQDCPILDKNRLLISIMRSQAFWLFT